MGSGCELNGWPLKNVCPWSVHIRVAGRNLFTEEALFRPLPDGSFLAHFHFHQETEDASFQTTFPKSMVQLVNTWSKPYSQSLVRNFLLLPPTILFNSICLTGCDVYRPMCYNIYYRLANNHTCIAAGTQHPTAERNAADVFTR